jgi:hypothetical protein
MAMRTKLADIGKKKMAASSFTVDASLLLTGD